MKSGTMDDAYSEAWKFTQQSQANGPNPRLPHEAMNEISYLKPGIGWQVVGMSNEPTNQNRVVLAHYYSPALVVGTITPMADGGVELVREEWIGWVGHLNDPTQKVRIYPEYAPGGDAKRAQGAIFISKTELLTWRNGEKDRFYQLLKREDGWQLGERFDLQGPNDGYMESVVPHNETIYVVRSRQDSSAAWLSAYSMQGEPVDTKFKCPAAPWIYGLAFRDGKPHFITDRRCDRIPWGIYCENKLVVPDVTGNSIVFLPDGSALVAQYNEGVGDWGQPCQLVRIPARYF